MEVATAPRKHPTSYMATIKPVIVGEGLLNVDSKAVEFTSLRHVSCGFRRSNRHVLWTEEN
jgi:hypothetical protein